MDRSDIIIINDYYKVKDLLLEKIFWDVAQIYRSSGCEDWWFYYLVWIEMLQTECCSVLCSLLSLSLLLCTAVSYKFWCELPLKWGSSFKPQSNHVFLLRYLLSLSGVYLPPLLYFSIFTPLCRLLPPHRKPNAFYSSVTLTLFPAYRFSIFIDGAKLLDWFWSDLGSNLCLWVSEEHGRQERKKKGGNERGRGIIRKET